MAAVQIPWFKVLSGAWYVVQALSDPDTRGRRESWRHTSDKGAGDNLLLRTLSGLSGRKRSKASRNSVEYKHAARMPLVDLLSILFMVAETAGDRGLVEYAHDVEEQLGLPSGAYEGSRDSVKQVVRSLGLHPRTAENVIQSVLFALDRVT